MAASAGFQVLLITPTGRDAKLIGRALNVADVQSETLKDIASAIEVFQTRDVGALLVAEEALEHEAINLLASALAEQPAWSALPVVVLTMGGKATAQSRRQERQQRSLGNTTLLERPIRGATLVSCVRAALDVRSHQYQSRTVETALRHSEKLATVGRLAASLAHEINNPLEAVTNLLYLLDGTPLNAEQKEYLDLAQRELERVSEIAANTLTFNRQRDVKGQAFMSALLDSVFLLYRSRLADSQIIVEYRYRNAASFSCYPGELRQVFANLIGNAFDATRKGGRILVRERPAIHPWTGQDGVRITIADTGHGMSAEVKARLFEAFHSTKDLNGTGLGLWISKGIIDKHAGHIRVRSSTKIEGSGTVFSLFLPRTD